MTIFVSLDSWIKGRKGDGKTYSPATLLVSVRWHLESTPVVSDEDTACGLETFVLDEHRALLLLVLVLLLGLVLADVGGD
jgi:hypothetical protein